jgi:hypothetical protein
MAFDTSKISAFCAEIQPGSEFSSLSALEEKHGVKIIGSFPAPDGPGSIAYVVAASTYGEGRCNIRYNENIIISATISGM